VPEVKAAAGLHTDSFPFPRMRKYKIAVDFICLFNADLTLAFYGKYRIITGTLLNAD
jgi:hypothetical protein